MGTDDRFAKGCAWIAGEYVPIAEARIPILDAGFTRSDLTYDVAGVWQGRFFRLEDHLDRLLRGCEQIRLTLPMPRDQVRDIMIETVRRSGLKDAYVQVIVTRGAGAPGERDSRTWRPRLYAYAIPYVWIVVPEMQEVGVDVIVAQNTRRIPSDSLDPTVKNFQWGDFVRGQYEAYDRGSSLAILAGADNLVTEGAGVNIFAYVDGVLRTPDSGVLHGITRKTVIEIAAEAGISLAVGDLRVGELSHASEIFLTSTAGGVMPVAHLDGAPVGNGKPGPITARIRERYWALHSDPQLSFAVDYPHAEN